MINPMQSTEAIENLRLALGNDGAYPYAFGIAWAMLTPKQKNMLVEMSRERLKEIK